MINLPCDHWMGPLHFLPEKCPKCEIERLKAQLWKYGKHLTACRLQKTKDTWCDCGWVEAREKLAPADSKPAESRCPDSDCCPTASGGTVDG